MGAVQWWDHSRVWLIEYDQSLKICKSMNIFYQPNRQTNPPKEILLRNKRSFLYVRIWVTYKSGGKNTQIDYMMCRRRNFKEMCDCKVIVNECVAKQHRMVICKMTFMVKKKKAEKIKPKIRCWKLRETSCQEAFRQEVTRILGGKNGLLVEWDKTVEILRKTAETVLGVTFGKRKGDRET